MSGDMQWGTSTDLREKGNEFFRNAHVPGLCSTIKKVRLQSALSCYKSALEHSQCPSDAASASKNVAVVSWKVGKIMCEEYSVHHSVDPVLYYFKNAFESFTVAVAMGALGKTQEWNDYLLQQTYDCLQDALTLSADLSAVDKKQFFDVLCQHVPVDDFKADWFIELCTMVFHEGVAALQGGDYKTCLSKMHDCYNPLEEAKRYCATEDHKREIRVLDADITSHIFSTEALQAREMADGLLTHVLLDEECVNFDMVWGIIDLYKRSILLTREMDVEIECISLCRIGRVYDKILKDKTRAKESFRTALNLSQTLFPRTFLNDDWYKECVSSLAQYQTESQMEEDEKERESKEQFLSELKPELDELDRQDTTTENLLKFVYKTYPPKNSEHKLELEGKNLKDVVKYAITHYHPDRQSEETHGKRWKVLAGEITKRLTNRYETFKQMDD